MTDKQKEAIERLKYDISAGEYSTTKTEVLETVLNLLQTQQAEIEKKDKESHFIQSKLDEANAEIIKLKRIIDEMSEQLTTPLHSKEWVKEYYEYKVETEDK